MDDKNEHTTPTDSSEDLEFHHLPTEANALPVVGDEEVEYNGDRDVEKATTPTTPQKPGEADTPAPTPGAFDPSQFPDGGLQAWLCVLGGFCALIVSFGWVNCIGVFQDYYQSTLLRQYSPSTISWIASLETFFMFFCGPIIGKLYDNYGPRYILLVGSFLHVFGIMMASLSTQYYQLVLSQGICSPIGASAIFYPALSALPTWFFKKRGAAFGICVAGSSLGGVFLPIMVQRLIVEAGFPWAMRSVAFLFLGLLVISNLTVTSRLPPAKKPWHLKEFFYPLKELTYDLTVFGGCLFFLGMFLPITYIILEADYYGMNPNLSQYLVSILNGASLFGRTLPGAFADKVGRYNMLVIMCFFTSILILAMWIPSTTNAPIIVFSALYGFGSGAFVSLAPSCIAQISDVRRIGVRTGTYFAIVSIAALISNPIGGALVTRDHGGYRGAEIFAGVMTMAGAVVLTAARVRQVGWKVRVKV